MNISLIIFTSKIPDEVKKLISVLEPEKLYIGKRHNEVENFCHWQKIPLAVLGTKKSLYCQKCEELVNNADYVIVCGNGLDQLFDYSVKYCKSKKKDFMVVWNE